MTKKNFIANYKFILLPMGDRNRNYTPIKDKEEFERLRTDGTIREGDIVLVVSPECVLSAEVNDEIVLNIKN